MGEVGYSLETGETVYDFGDGEGHVPAKRHINPDGSVGGWVSEDSRVRMNSFVHPTSFVFGKSVVRRTRIGPDCRIKYSTLTSPLSEPVTVSHSEITGLQSTLTGDILRSKIYPIPNVSPLMLIGLGEVRDSELIGIAGHVEDTALINCVLRGVDLSLSRMGDLKGIRQKGGRLNNSGIIMYRKYQMLYEMMDPNDPTKIRGARAILSQMMSDTYGNGER